MSETTRGGATDLVLAFLAGALTGAAVALLTAPQAGRETRRRLKGLASGAAAGATRVPPALGEAYARAADAARQAFLAALDDRAAGSGPQAGRGGH